MDATVQEDPHRAGLRDVIEGEEHEKKSVLKKVKDKAKKIKDTLSKKMHNHEDDQGYEEDDGEEAVMEEDPAVHVAAVSKTDAKIGVAGNEELPRKDCVDLGNVTEEDPGAPKGKFDPFIPGSYQTNVTDSGSTGEGVPGLIRSFKTISVSDQPERAEGHSTTGSDDLLSLDSISSADHPLSQNPRDVALKDAGGVEEIPWDAAVNDAGGAGEVPRDAAAKDAGGVGEVPWDAAVKDAGGAGEVPRDAAAKGAGGAGEVPWDAAAKGAGGAGEVPWDAAVKDAGGAGEVPRDAAAKGAGGAGEPRDADVADVVEDVGGAGERQRPSVTSVIVDKAAAAKNAAIAAAVGTTEYGKKIASTVYEKVAGAGTAVPDSTSSQNPEAVSDKDAGELGKGNADEKRSSATSGIAGKAASAKDAAISAAAGTTEYGKKIASTVYEKVAGAGSAALAKVQPANAGTGGGEKGQQDRGVSVKEFLAEKLSPGEEDRALCEAITDAIYTRQREEEDVREEPNEKAREVAEKLVRPSDRSGPDGRAGEGVVGKIRGAVTSLFAGGGPGGESHAVPESGVHPGGTVERPSDKQDDPQVQVTTN